MLQYCCPAVVVVQHAELATEIIKKATLLVGTCCCCPAVVVVQYATDVKNLIINNLRQRFWGKHRNVTSFVLKIGWNTPSPT